MIILIELKSPILMRPMPFSDSRSMFQSTAEVELAEEPARLHFKVRSHYAIFFKNKFLFSVKIPSPTLTPLSNHMVGDHNFLVFCLSLLHNCLPSESYLWLCKLLKGAEEEELRGGVERREGERTRGEEWGESVVSVCS